jgi:hypothetical protein
VPSGKIAAFKRYDRADVHAGVKRADTRLAPARAACRVNGDFTTTAFTRELP